MPPRGWAPLLTLDHEQGTAGVYRDRDGLLWLSGGRDGGTMLDDGSPAHEGLDGDLSVAGGRLPPRATKALVRDARGEMQEAATGAEVWLVVLHDHVASPQPVARFHDADGEIVPVPLPDGATSEPVPDADERCPACDAADWHDVRWTQEWAVADAREEMEALRCGRCGHTEQGGGTVVSLEIDDDDTPVTRRLPPDWSEQERREHLGVFERAGFPVYGLSDAWTGERSIGGWGDTRRRLTEIHLDHGSSEPGPHVTVETMRGGEDDWRSDREICVDALSALLDSREEIDLERRSHAALSLWFAASHRRQSERAARAEPSTVAIPVDGRPVDFYLLADGDRWAACGRFGEVAVKITAADVAPSEIELVRIDDPEPYL
jgi:hypothetical protein